MSSFRVSSRTLGSVEVEAPNWMVALGEGLGVLGASVELDRIACEVLGNGAVLVRDVRRGDGYVVQPVTPGVDGAAAVEEEILTADSASEEELRPEVIAGALEPIPPIEPEPPSEERAADMAWILGAPNRELACERAMAAALRAVPAESASVLAARRGGALQFVAATGPEAAKVRDLAISGATGLAGFCIRTGTALTVREAYLDDRFDRRLDDLTGYKTRGLLCLPVAFEGRVWGCLELLNPVSSEGFPRAALGEVGLLASALGERLARSGPVSG